VLNIYIKAPKIYHL